MIFFKKADSYKKFLQLERFLNGEIKEIRKVLEEKTIVIRGANAADLSDYEEEIKNQGIVEFSDLKSRKQNVSINMVKASCKSPLEFEKLLKIGLKVGLMNYRAVKFIKKPNLVIC